MRNVAFCLVIHNHLIISKIQIRIKVVPNSAVLNGIDA